MNIDFKKYKHFPKISSSVIVAAFLMPFMLVKCGNTTIASLNGINLALGSSVGKGDKSQLLEPNIFAILALILAIGAIILAFKDSRQTKIISLVIAIAGALSLVLLYIQLLGKANMNTEKVTISLGIGFYLAFIGFTANSVFYGAYLKKGDHSLEEKTSSDTTLDDQQDEII